ncbi:PTS transporter subunit EIIC [Spiroplasma tabanidicola]|uniref:PTS system, sucrose-specific IIB component n=1 Tax=Spiroplasma tabanidicola TaxID=324079 RepID=A0A6I6CHQ6_9MOLU|nr:PTS transporter subunit EIIC [Spiroplasma tabanidicola]QGS51583.1 PTS system, sucrose-specific IIB component [Spiroplasma tabanidicola]
MAKINYKQEAKTFLDHVGGWENIESFLHCYTRMRYNVIDKNKVNVDEIQKSKIVKGVNWSGNQVQIILGAGVVDKIDEETSKIKLTASSFEMKANVKAKNNKNIVKRAMSTLGDIFLPIIPALVAAGMLMGLSALLVQTKAISQNTRAYDIFSILTDTAFSFLAVLVCWSTVKRFGGSPVIGIVIGIMLVNPILPSKSAINLYEKYKEFIDSGHTDSDWEEIVHKSVPAAVEAWKIGFLKITGYQGSVLPPLVLGIGAAFLEKGLRKIVPNFLNMIITPFVTIAVIFLAGLLLLGPLLQYVEEGILIASTWFLKIKFGFGTAILSGIVQAIVITGCHQLLQGLEIQMVIQGSIDGSGSMMNAVWTASIASQAGAGIAVALKEQNRSKMKVLMSSVAPALFGITEPVIFGVNLPKTKPFLCGLAGGFIAGLFAGALNVSCSGMGVTVIPGLLLYSGNVRNLLLIICVNAIAIGAALGLTLLVYRDRITLRGVVLKSIAKEEKVEKENKKEFSIFFLNKKDEVKEVNSFLNKYKKAVVAEGNIQYSMNNAKHPEKYEEKLAKAKVVADEYREKYDKEYKVKSQTIIDEAVKTLKLESRELLPKLEKEFVFNG